MQTATIMLSLAGDSGQQFQKYNVTPAEVAVLRAIHGEGAVTDVDINEVEAEDDGRTRTDRAELGRLRGMYDKREPGVTSAIDALFPGAASRVFATFAELDLPDEFYVAEERKPKKAPKRKDPNADLDKMSKTELLKTAKDAGLDTKGLTTELELIDAIISGRNAKTKTPTGNALEGQTAVDGKIFD